MYQRLFKRQLDTVFAIICIILLSPLMLVSSILLIFTYKSVNILFIQERPGLHAKTFRILKFKTMNDNKDAEGKLLPDSNRLTGIGRILRSSSIDELPQLINVLKGEMSFIGPRPLLTRYLTLYDERQSRRHEVRPGITGWAQINGRNNTSWRNKLELDVFYVENISFRLDLKIFLLSIIKVLRRDGISKTGEATTVLFNGAN